MSWHYTLRSVDGHIAQHVKAKDVGWHAGNWYVNAKSIGIEHEGFAAQGTWYTEAMYRTSAKLVRHLALRFGIPLDRQHILGHDNVPGTIAGDRRRHALGPGPVLGLVALLRPAAGARSGTTGTPRTGLVTIDPDFATNRPAFTGCNSAAGVRAVPPAAPCPLRGSSSVILRTAPSADAPLVNDLGLRPDGTPNTMYISDHGARASAGQTYAVAERRATGRRSGTWARRRGSTTRPSAPTAKWARGLRGDAEGRARRPSRCTGGPTRRRRPIRPASRTRRSRRCSTRSPAGQRYAVGARAAGRVLPGDHLRRLVPGDWTVVRGEKRYVQIQFGHRIDVRQPGRRADPAVLGGRPE